MWRGIFELENLITEKLGNELKSNRIIQSRRNYPRGSTIDLLLTGYIIHSTNTHCNECHDISVQRVPRSECDTAEFKRHGWAEGIERHAVVQ